MKTILLIQGKKERDGFGLNHPTEWKKW